ncbi:unnamed protein product [Effrenium voratum]|uniref:Uncharacterized protein n=1 Tax=Effrenium voratum TaxID=2562239 RepID=A0AA36HX34_9DINO|nr:unnamed protein product [Effrenium voratum]CAJ1376958.1 unnamed protein product [Effrenium voratum]
MPLGVRKDRPCGCVADTHNGHSWGNRGIEPGGCRSCSKRDSWCRPQSQEQPSPEPSKSIAWCRCKASALVVTAGLFSAPTRSALSSQASAWEDDPLAAFGRMLFQQKAFSWGFQDK